jgi:glc operon protein GlcG
MKARAISMVAGAALCSVMSVPASAMPMSNLAAAASDLALGQSVRYVRHLDLCAAQVTNKPVLTLDGAKQIIAAAASHARTKAGTAAIAIVDDGGNLIALELLDNTFPAAANISMGKARTAAIFKKPTLTFEDTVNKGRTSMTTLKDFTALQGGVPIEVDGKVVGAIGVSGAANAQEDLEVAMAGASAASHFASQGGGELQTLTIRNGK